DRVADLVQRAAQLGLLGALHDEIAHRERGRGEQRHDRDRDDELDQGESCPGLTCAAHDALTASARTVAAAARPRTAPWWWAAAAARAPRGPAPAFAVAPASAR